MSIVDHSSFSNPAMHTFMFNFAFTVFILNGRYCSMWFVTKQKKSSWWRKSRLECRDKADDQVEQRRYRGLKMSSISLCVWILDLTLDGGVLRGCGSFGRWGLCVTGSEPCFLSHLCLLVWWDVNMQFLCTQKLTGHLLLCLPLHNELYMSLQVARLSQHYVS